MKLDSEENLDNEPSTPQSRRDLSVSLIRIGDIKLDNGDVKAALAAYLRARDIRDKLVADEPQNNQAQRDLYVSLMKVGDGQVLCGDSKAALTSYLRSLEIREKLLAAKALESGDMYDMACSYALCIPLTDKSDMKEQYAVQAIELLRQAAAGGFKDVDHMKKDSDLDALRQRDDFKKFVAELQSKNPPAIEPGKSKK